MRPTLTRWVGVLAAAALWLPFAAAALAADGPAPDPAKELERAKKLLAAGERRQGYLVGGDAYRALGDYAKAVLCYRKVLPTRRRRLRGFEKKALAGLDEIEKKVLQTIDDKALRDGKYTSEGVGYRGLVRVTVIVKDGKIHSVRVTRQRESRPRSALTRVPGWVVGKNDVRGVDVVSGATYTSKGILKATTYALAGAIPPPAEHAKLEPKPEGDRETAGH